MRRFVLGATAAAFAACALAPVQTPTSFKLGTFERQGRTFVGIVLRDTVVIGTLTNPVAGPTATPALR